MVDKNADAPKITGMGLDVHGVEPVAHPFTINDDSAHEAYVLLTAGRSLAAHKGVCG